MARFGKMLDKIQRIKSEGFDPTQETYMERLSQNDDPSLTPQQIRSAKKLFKEYPESRGLTERGYIMADDELFGLDKETVERNLPVKDGKIDREGEIKVDVDREALDQIEVMERDGEIQYGTRLNSNASKIPKSYYSQYVGYYNPIEDTYSETSSESSFGRRLRRESEAKLKNIIENEIDDEMLNKYNLTRQQLLDQFVQTK